jgi:hypothetical protein
MKSLLLFVALLFAVALSGSSTTSVANEANAGNKERATVTFDQPFNLMGKVLQGEYLVVHDDAAMARGEACTSVYKGRAENSDRLVVAFHCTPTARDTVKHFTVRSVMTPAGIAEIREFQFKGSSEGHLVPVAVD